MLRRARTLAAASTAIVLALGGVLLAAAPASAAIEPEVNTPGWQWANVNDDTLYISDVYSYETLYNGVPNFFGWNNDGFDGFILGIDLTFTPDVGLPQTLPAVLTNVDSDFNDYGLSTVSATGIVDFGGGNDIRVNSLLSIEGNSVQWSFGFDDGGAGILDNTSVHVSGELGSDTDTTIEYQSGGSLVTSQGSTGDPVIAYQFVSASPFAWDVANGDDIIAVDFGAGAAQLTVALAESDPCQFDEAVAAMIARSAVLDVTFGETIPAFYAPGCLVAAPAAALPLGTPVNKVLPLTASAELEAYYGGPFVGFSDFTGVVVSGLPAGLSATLQYNAVTTQSEIVITGTPTAGGVYNLIVMGYFVEEAINYQPLFISVPLSVALAATGSSPDAAPLALIALALLGAGGAVMFVTRMSRKRA